MSKGATKRNLDDHAVTRLLEDYSAGDHSALNRLIPLVYQELRRLAQSYMSRERRNHTLQATALVHEAFIKLIDQHSVQWHSRAHFFAVAASLMRRLLTDHARAKKAMKRGGAQSPILFDEALYVGDSPQPDLILLDDALKKLAKVDEKQVQIVELRYFGGLTIEETAGVLKLSPATVKRYWTLAKTWLSRELSEKRDG